MITLYSKLKKGSKMADPRSDPPFPVNVKKELNLIHHYPEKKIAQDTHIR